MSLLTQAEIGALHEALDDEYKAWSTYDQVIHDLGPERPFINIVEREFAGVTARFVGHANALLDGLRASGQLPAGALAAPVVLDATLRAPSRYYFLDSLPSGAAPGAGWMDALRTDAAVRAASLRAATQFAEWLLQLNANRVAGDLDERVVESRRRVEGALRRSLEEIATTAEEAASRARAARERGEGAVSQAVETVEGRLAELDAIEGAVGASKAEPT
jgi:hypothetical protein